MKHLNTSILTAFAGLAAIALMAGCATSSPAANQASTKSRPAAKEAKADTKGGAQLWAQNCSFCHNIRSPSAFNNAQWDVIMLHMRVRANLTAHEHKAILDFLKSAD